MSSYLDMSDTIQNGIESTSLPSFNTSMEGDFWSATGAPGTQGGGGQMQTDLFQEEMFFDAPPMQQQQSTMMQSSLLYHPQQSPPPVSSHKPSPQYIPAQAHYVSSSSAAGPPAHLFATPFSPFAHAAFEVEDDLNGVNPSSLYLSHQQQQQQQQQQPSASPTALARGGTGESMIGFNNSLHIGKMAPMAQQPQYDSLIDQEVEAGAIVPSSRASKSNGGAAPATSTRKRARGPTGAAQPTFVNSDPVELSPDDELRNLDASTFNVGALRSVAGQSNGSDSPTNNSEMPTMEKKQKHQLTDRQRRAKIKESMDALKALVPLEPNQKADQATIVASSVTLVQNLKDEVAELRARLQAMEFNAVKEASKLDAKRSQLRGAQGMQPHLPTLSNSPFTSMMASLNGAGVSMWRIGLTGKIIEVNLVFELPLFGSLSIMPSAFLRAFSEVSTVPQLNNAGDPLEHTRGYSEQQQAVSPNSSSSPHSLEFPSTPSSSHSSSAGTTVPPAQQHHANGSSSSAPGSPTVVKTEVMGVNPNSTAQTQGSQASVAPLYANASISNFPVVPQTELENFFPVKCRSLIHAHPKDTGAGNFPQPHGSFLVNHLAALPYNHVLKLLSRHHTLWGEILESIVTLCLVRDANGQPDYIMLLSTPDCRRLLTPATHVQSPGMSQAQVQFSPAELAKMDQAAALERRDYEMSEDL